MKKRIIAASLFLFGNLAVGQGRRTGRDAGTSTPSPTDAGQPTDAATGLEAIRRQIEAEHRAEQARQEAETNRRSAEAVRADLQQERDEQWSVCRDDCIFVTRRCLARTYPLTPARTRCVQLHQSCETRCRRRYRPSAEAIGAIETLEEE